MLKKIVSLVVGATLVLATLGVSAATVATTSVYNADDSSKIDVVTTVTNTGSADETYTYLAYKLATGGSLENLTKQEVVYVDEQTAAAGANAEFSYTTSASNNEAVVLVGGDASVDNEPQEDEISVNVTKSYTVQVGDGNVENKTLDVTTATSATLVTIAADLSNVVISDVTLNGEPFVNYIAKDDGLYIPYSEIEDEPVVNFVINTTSGAVASAVNIWRGAYFEEDGVKAIIALAKVEGKSANFGITFSDDADHSYNFAAKGAGTEGMYAIRLNNVDQSVFKDAAKIYAKAYADDNVSAGTVEITIQAAAEEN